MNQVQRISNGKRHIFGESFSALRSLGGGGQFGEGGSRRGVANHTRGACGPQSKLDGALGDRRPTFSMQKAELEYGILIEDEDEDENEED
jgi:hypothetical protein